jgi:CTP:phosphocholine cytidylyltransferase-like protein/thiamine kinase-like enzyme
MPMTIVIGNLSTIRTDHKKYRVKNAIILAAGFGSRCVPLTFETPKGLLKVHGQPMIERQIEQLIEKEITEIIIVVGYKKENFDYLIDKYNVKLVYNPEYSTKNNLATLYHVSQYLGSTYLLMSDHFIKDNIFNKYESRSWYSCTYFDGPTSEWCVEASPSGKIESLEIGGKDSLAVLGPAYFSPSLSETFKQLLTDYYNRPGTEDYYWEQVLLDHIKRLVIYVNIQTGNVHEFENLEELRKFDPSYDKESNNEILKSIARHFDVPEYEIQNIYPIKKGLTNDSFHFSIGDKEYVYRVPGAGTDKLIDRIKEYEVYQVIIPLGICDDIEYLDAGSGHKIAVFWKNARVCDPFNPEDVEKCMGKLRDFHALKLKVNHDFNIFDQIMFYESLLSFPSCFNDYEETRTNVMSLKEYIDTAEKEIILAHIDSVPDNFLFIPDGAGGEEIRLIDWEYAGMHDKHIDIAMFAVYAMYDREHVEALIDSYFKGKCPYPIRIKIYAYIALCGLLWSNWCEYKREKGIEYGEYAMRQYRFAKDYYKIFMEKGEK